MADPFVGEIRMFGGNFAPVGWFFCDGSTLAISQYEVLYALIGTTYGGDGQQTFKLPDLRGRLPLHQSPNFPMGMVSGTELVTLTNSQMPTHSHMLMATPAVGGTEPGSAIFATDPASAVYFTPDGTRMNAGTISPTGGNQPHSNMMPYLCISFIIAYEGIYPSQG